MDTLKVLLIDRHIPQKMIITSDSSESWITEGIKQMLKIKHPRLKEKVKKQIANAKMNHNASIRLASLLLNCFAVSNCFHSTCLDCAAC